MTTSPSRLAYQDCYELLDMALADDRGVRVKMDNKGAAKQCRQRLHKARVIDREENQIALADGHPMQGKSQYDYLEIRVEQEDDGLWLTIERKDTRKYEVQSLSQWLDKERENKAWRQKELIQDLPATVAQQNQGITLIRRRI